MSDDIGHIYLAVNDNQQGLVKVGYTRGSVEKRMKELSAATGVSRPFHAAYSCKVQNPEAVETQLHQEFAYCHENKEFFRIDWRAVKAALRMMQADSKRLGESQTAKNDGRVSKFTLIKWVKVGDADKVRQVLTIGGNPNQDDLNGQTALIWAAGLGHVDIVNILLDANANPNKADKRHSTPLMVAAQEDNFEVVKSLLDGGAEIDAKDSKGETALMKAQSNNHAKVVQILLANGASECAPPSRAQRAPVDVKLADFLKLHAHHREHSLSSIWGYLGIPQQQRRSHCLHREITQSMLQLGWEKFMKNIPKGNGKRTKEAFFRKQWPYWHAKKNDGNGN